MSKNFIFALTAILSFVAASGCAKLSTRFDPNCSAPLTNSSITSIFTDALTSNSSLIYTDRFFAGTSAPTIISSQTSCASGSDCGMLYPSHVTSIGVTPANIRVRAQVSNSIIAVRSDGSTSLVALGQFSSTQVKLIYGESGVLTQVACNSGSDSITDCPSAIYTASMDFDLTVVGCSPNISTTARINGVLVPKFSLQGLSGPDSGRIGFSIDRVLPGTVVNLQVDSKS